MINYLEAKAEIYEIAKNYEELGDYYANKDNKNEALINLFVTDFEKLANEAEFNGLEKLKYILIDFEEFTNNNNCLTPTMKIIRKNLEKKYKERIDELYESIGKK